MNDFRFENENTPHSYRNPKGIDSTYQDELLPSNISNNTPKIRKSKKKSSENFSNIDYHPPAFDKNPPQNPFQFNNENINNASLYGSSAFHTNNDDILYVGMRRNDDLMLKQKNDYYNVSGTSTARTSLSLDSNSRYSFTNDEYSEFSETDSTSSRFTDFSNSIIRGAQKSFRNKNPPNVNNYPNSLFFKKENSRKSSIDLENDYFSNLNSVSDIDNPSIIGEETLLNYSYKNNNFHPPQEKSYSRIWFDSENSSSIDSDNDSIYKKLSTQKYFNNKNPQTSLPIDLNDFNIFNSNPSTRPTSRLSYSSQHFNPENRRSSTQSPNFVKNKKKHNSYNFDNYNYNSNLNKSSSSYTNPVNNYPPNYLENYNFSNSSRDPEHILNNYKKSSLVNKNLDFGDNNYTLNTNPVPEFRTSSNYKNSINFTPETYSENLSINTVKKSSDNVILFPTKGLMYYILFLSTGGITVLHPILSSICFDQLL
ncbi:hypothetical protein AYI70_g4868 [Smittium culicis]|uniref:Uncharacterized protein n=1 Tax=Smittium culicis TaxID=133412 RepID=A0A1R1XHX5_9FUNG|nr:hypothetical protein AYI70_g8005 [Smittium culicis]OMJ19207.1 hypothetical protein AYI70_g4868 [Smittium culicis]